MNQVARTEFTQIPQPCSMCHNFSQIIPLLVYNYPKQNDFFISHNNQNGVLAREYRPPTRHCGHGICLKCMDEGIEIIEQVCWETGENLTSETTVQVIQRRVDAKKKKASKTPLVCTVLELFSCPVRSCREVCFRTVGQPYVYLTS